MEHLNSEIEECKLCALGFQRTHACTGKGNVHANVMIVGEAPGKNEDKVGCPFVGHAGKRLEELLKIACLTSKDAYITNVCKRRPCIVKDNREKDRPPTNPEIEACAGYLNREISIVQPRIIVALGCTAAARLLGRRSVVMRKIHGEAIEKGSLIFPTYHPAARWKSQQTALERDFDALKSLLRTFEL